MSNTTPDMSEIRFGKCIGCPDMGRHCMGPDFMALTGAELRAWVKAWKKYYNLTQARCVEIWNVPDGTVTRFLGASELIDFKYTTIRAIIMGIIGYGKPADHQIGTSPCPATSSEIAATVAEIETQLAAKTAECEKLTKKKLERAEEYTEHMAEQRENFEHRLSKQQETIDFLRQELARERAMSTDYLARIDVKNRQLDERAEEIRQLNKDRTALYDRILEMAGTHTARRTGTKT